MPYLLLFFSLFFVSCRKDNQLKSAPVAIASSEQKSYMSVSHEAGESLLRSRLLNQLVEQKFPLNKIENAVKNYDELDGVKMSKDDLSAYMEKERLMTKLIVSYSDRLDIYFLPRGVVLEQIPSQLGLSPESGKVLKWLETPAKTVEGSTLYLINVNHEDLMENDKKFYLENHNYTDFSDKKSFILVDGKEAEISLKHLFYKERAAAQTFKGKLKTCTRDLMEAGDCTECLYQRYVSTGQFELEPNVSLDEVGFRLMINGERFFTSELPVELSSDGVMRFTIRGGSSKSTKSVLEIEKTQAPSYEVDSSPVNYTGHCAKVEGRQSVTLQSRAEIYLNVKIRGRGEMLRAVSL